MTERFEVIDDNTVVVVTNDYNSSVGYKIEGYTKTWDVGTSKRIKFSELLTIANDRGGRFLLNEGFLLIREAKVREALGLDELNEYLLSGEEIEDLLVNGDIKELEDLLQFCSDTTLEKVVAKAIDGEVNSLEKIELVKSYSGIDVSNIRAEKREDAKLLTNGDNTTATTNGAVPVRKRKE